MLLSYACTFVSSRFVLKGFAIWEASHPVHALGIGISRRLRKRLLFFEAFWCGRATVELSQKVIAVPFDILGSECKLLEKVWFARTDDQKLNV